jgi:type VI secretion system secreted protein VgrG
MPAPAITAILENRKLKLKGPLPETKAFIKSARVVEGLSQITQTTIDFMAHDRNAKMEDMVGQPHTLQLLKNNDLNSPQWREYRGTCIESSYLGLQEGFSFFTLEIRPWIWFLTKTWNNRIFQNLNAVDIIKKVFSDRGFSDYTVTVSRTPDVRVYTVQYNETDYAFICRLMEEEGMYFYSTVRSEKDHLVITDGASGHTPVDGMASIPYATRESSFRKTTSHIFEWRAAESARGGKVTLRDYDFEAPSADRTVVKAIPKGNHSHKNYESFRYPGHYRKTPLGEIYARVKMEAEACPHLMGTAIGDVATLATGATFTLTDHERSAENAEYLITSAVHLMQVEVDQKDESQNIAALPNKSGTTQQAIKLPSSIEFDEENKDTYRCTFRTIKKAVPFRAPQATPWPSIPGILVAKVTGPSGEEIYTDQYGRIKVQFPWDREGRNDENTTCWIRVVTPWAGKNWGMISVPRIGQEVVIQFEDGDIDRPICTGMLYNAEYMPPYALPANMTQTGIVTRSSKGGGTSTFNELIFEDKKDAEFVRLQSEKDYKETIKNNAVITVGMEKKDPGDYTMTIYHHRSEFVKTGDSTFKVEQGNEIRDIKTDKTETIGQHSTKEVKGNLKSTVKGNENHEITGNNEKKVTGTYTNDVTGAITIESKQSITLKVGGNSIVIDQSGITIKGIMITTDASGMATHKSGGIMTIQGSMVMIN